MPQVNYTAMIDIARPEVWDFVRDMNNWAPFAQGYQEHEVLNDRESVWTVKGEVGPITRSTKFHVKITEWIEGEGVEFTLDGINEPITGGGAIRLVDAESGGGTEIRADAGIEFGGSIGPVVNQLITPWIKGGADDLVTKIAIAVQPDYEKPKQPFFVLRWLRAIGRMLAGLASLVRRSASGGESGAVATAPAPAAIETDVKGAFQVETLLMAPGLEQYTGGTAGPIALEGIGRAAAKIEEMGFDGVTTPEAGHDPFLPLTIAAEHTGKILLGTNVAIAFPRSPMVSAQIAWDLQSYSGGRFRMGLGTQVKGHNERRYSTPWPSPPGPRMREYVLCMQAMLRTFQTGERPEFTGEHYRFTLMSPFFNPGPIDHPDVPIYIAALNKYMAGVAGELCQGIRLHPLISIDYMNDVILPSMEAGAVRGGRTLADVDIVASPFLVTGETAAEVEAAKAAAKQQIAFYSSTRTYHAVLKHHGWGEVGQTLHALSIEGKWQGMFDLIDDDILDAFSTIGTYDELAPKLKERWGGVATTMFLGMSPQMLAKESTVRGIVDELHRP